MSTSVGRPFALGLLLALALLTGAAPAARAQPAAPAWSAAAPAFAEESVSFTRWLKSFLNRAHIVQICVVLMLLALFIIMKKLDVPRL